MKRLKRLCFGLMFAAMAVLTTATVLEKCYGTPFAASRIYGAAWFAALWGALAVTALIYIFRRRLQRRPAALLLHLSFAVILLGAFVTWRWGVQGTLHLRADDSGVCSFTGSGGAVRPLPFRVRLDDFRVEYYPGTQAPMDYVSLVTIVADDAIRQGEVAMNRILRFRGYRFYQSSYDGDGAGATLSVSCDPWGIGISYAGYGLLLCSMLCFCFDRRSGLRRLFRHPALRRSALLVLFAAGAVQMQAAEGSPPVLPRDVAAELGNLHVYYNDRICPLSTLAADFTKKLCGKGGYNGLTAEQVLSGWMFWYDEWKEEPMIRIKSAEARRSLGLEGRYARLTDFRRALSAAPEVRKIGEADEKFNLVSMISTGSMLRIFPYAGPADSVLRWASQVDELPGALPREEWLFIRRSMNYVNELVAKQDWNGVGGVLQKIRVYQQQVAGASLPSEARFRAERFYNRMDYAFPAAVLLVLAGFALFVYACRRMALRQPFGRRVLRAAVAILAAGALYLTLALALRGYVSGHWPLANGYETMQFMAWCALMLTLAFYRRFMLLLPFGSLIGGLALLVSALGSADPQITPLMPVLSSPLLSIHVMLVMAAYSLFAFVLLNGAAGLLLGRSHCAEAGRLVVMGRLMLYPAVFCLAAGIFIGAIWANVSWGRYWGWDPKETWALITLLAYALPLHGESLPWFRRPEFFHAYCVAAFFAVLITYFGVNFLLGGMHSYAG